VTPYIWFEGMDGSGKSSLCRAVSDALSTHGRAHARIAFPGRHSIIGSLIRDVFDGKVVIDPSAMLWLFAADARDCEARIRQHIADGAAVLCDRHTVFSARIYQTREHGMAAVRAVQDAARLSMPDRIYMLDVPAEVALERRAARQEKRNELYEPEQLAEVEQQRAAYRNVAEEFPQACILDGRYSPAALLAHVLDDLGIG